MVDKEKARINPWIISTIILLILVGVLFVGNFGSGNSADKDVVANSILEFVKSQGVDAKIVNISEDKNFYVITLSFLDQEVPLYATKDGEFLMQGIIPLEGIPKTPKPTEIPKKDIPIVELFIWGYCPYGVQAQGPLAEVASLLGDKADFKAILYYAGHGEHEVEQNKIQECMQKIAPDKYWDYADGFVENIYPKCGSSRDIDCDKTESINLMESLGINSQEIMDCVETDGDNLINESSHLAQKFGITGSPTIMINGVIVDVARTAEAYKTAVCESFNDAPEECTTTLDSTSASSGSC